MLKVRKKDDTMSDAERMKRAERVRYHARLWLNKKYHKIKGILDSSITDELKKIQLLSALKDFDKYLSEWESAQFFVEDLQDDEEIEQEIDRAFNYRSNILNVKDDVDLFFKSQPPDNDNSSKSLSIIGIGSQNNISNV